jgi:hypothetical protein
MAFLGNTNITQAFTPAVDYFNGNASTTVFTLSRPVGSIASVEVFIENVPQNPASAYSVLNNTITFTSAPPTGTSNIYVRYMSTITQTIGVSQGVVGINQLSATGTPSANTFLRGDNTWGNAASSGIFYENGQNVTADYTITAGNNAMSAGPITIDTGVNVTVPTNSNWVIV